MVKDAKKKARAAAIDADTVVPTGKPKNSPPRPRKARVLPPANAFIPRTSRMDFETVDKEASEYRGWYNLIVLMCIFWVLSVVVKNSFSIGQPVSLALFYKSIRGFPMLVLGALSSCCFACSAYVLQCLIVAGIVKGKLIPILQHTLQSTLFAMFLGYIWVHDFGWLQSGALAVHSIVMFMKMHSYVQTNRMLMAANEKHTSKRAGKSIDGWCTTDDESLQKRKVQYPHNVTLKDFLWFLWSPTLVYDTSYPRTDRIRFWYVAEKLGGCLVTLILLYTTTEHYIIPVLEKMSTMPILDTYCSLLIPFIACYNFIFFIIFEVICNCVAELSYFADREFYTDWWNSLTFDEYARKWNKPVHEWLLRHVYLESIDSYKVSRVSATLVTFLFSSLLHELVLVVAVKRVKMFFFMAQLTQLPLIALGRLPIVKRHPRIANMCFWAGLVVGPPLLCLVYVQDAYLGPAASTVS